MDIDQEQPQKLMNICWPTLPSEKGVEFTVPPLILHIPATVKELYLTNFLSNEPWDILKYKLCLCVQHFGHHTSISI